jgi:hypothetical protein
VKKNLFLMCAVFLLLGMGASSALAQNESLQDLWFNVNGSNTELTAPGVNLSAYNSSTGLGTITFTDLNTGSQYFNTWWQEAVSVPFYNEYGTPVGTPSAGESWEIGDAYTSTSFSDAEAGVLLNKNLLPEGASNYLGTCTGACNGTGSTALGDAFVVTVGDEEIITLTVSQSAPSGFYLDQTHPVDLNNPTAQDVYFSLSAEEIPAGPPPATPEPSTWLLMLTGLAAGAIRLRRRFQIKAGSKLLTGLLLLIAGLVIVPFASAQSVNTVPWDPTNLAAPHTAYSGATVVLGAIFNTAGSPDSFTYVWNFGDGTAVGSAAVLTNPNDISSSHIYAGTTVGKTWTAVVTVTDTTTHAQYTGNYLVIWENNNLQSRVNVAIDWGLWYLHQNMYRPDNGVGDWTWAGGCAPGYAGYACGSGYGSLDATNIQAFEVNGHLATGPASDPYTADVQQALDNMFKYLATTTSQSKTYTFNTATANYGCSDGSAPQPGGACAGAATKVFFNPGGTTCLVAGSCTFTFDGNSNGLMAYASQNPAYEDGMYADAIVASGNPGGNATTGAVSGEKYSDIVQDMADYIDYCQYPGDNYDVEVGYTRGSEPYQGGGWWYGCQEGSDNSVSQWNAIGLIGASRGFNLAIPKIVSDANNMWVTASQDVGSPVPQPDDPGGNYYTDAKGAFGYNGAYNYSNAWGPYAVTPSGMVQMSLDGIGRTKNTTFSDATTAADQRFNNAETFYADNFCNSTTSGSYTSAYYSPRNYTYGLFSFTKSMLLHNPLGVLTPIQYLRTQTPGVFTTNPSVPANTIDWYSALSPANGGSDPCDGVAQTIVGRQYPAGFWYGDNVSGAQYPYETAWSLIMLRRTVFVNCVNNLGGAGTAAGTSPARIDLTWTGIPNVTGYDVLRSSTTSGPYTEVGSTTTTAYSDRVGLTSGNSYYYVLQPFNGSGAVCQSNQATITIPKKR